MRFSKPTRAAIYTKGEERMFCYMPPPMLAIAGRTPKGVTAKTAPRCLAACIRTLGKVATHQSIISPNILLPQTLHVVANCVSYPHGSKGGGHAEVAEVAEVRSQRQSFRTSAICSWSRRVAPRFCSTLSNHGWENDILASVPSPPSPPSNVFQRVHLPLLVR
mmetsp:Transcript_38332/g.81824  ORF Transcript_38332/g.81824 Transcript_38332/m.81824 type:complete len:163 (-) Transcript_38332:667-1155(-)